MMNDIVYFYPSGHQAHYADQHPERPERIEAIREGLRDMGWWDRYDKLPAITVDEQVLYKIHEREYIEALYAACQAGEWYDQDTYLTPASFDLALKAAGGAMAVVRAVWDKEAHSGFALCRPPGHHAVANHAMGFCLLNNIALAAEDLIQTRGARRLAIIDIDLHHGNGTQDIFWNRDDVFYFSTHQWPLYPYTGRLEDIGIGEGEGTTANLPFPPGTGDEGFLAGFDQVFLPLLDRYQPEMLLVSVGFDSHWLDPLGFLQLSGRGYGQIIARLHALADKICRGRVALILEGGYDLRASASCAQACVASLLQQNWSDEVGEPPYRANERWKGLIDQAILQWGLSS
jgi:acetoin utilization deacetylase AcuC-like enzyme